MNGKKSVYIIYSLLLIITAAAYLFMFSGIGGAEIFGGIFITGTKMKFLLLGITVLIILLSLMLSFAAKIAFEEKFIIFYALSGILFMLFMPYPNAPGEVSQFLRIYEITEKHVIPNYSTSLQASGDELPYNLDVVSGGDTYSQISQSSDVKADKREYCWYSISNEAALSSPLPYIPQLVGVMIGKIFTHNVIGICTAGRIAAFVFTLILLYISIKMLPFKKSAVLMIACIPVFLQQAVSLSADGITNTLCIFTFSYALYLIYKKDSIKGGDIALIYITAISLALCKTAAIPFLLMYILIPKKKFASTKLYYISLVLVFAIAIALNAFWLKKAANPSCAYSIKYIMQNPLLFAGMVIKSFASQITNVYFTMIGTGMGVGDININKLLIVIYTAVTITVVLSDLRLKPFAKCIAVIVPVIFLSIVLIGFGAYVCNTKSTEAILLSGRNFTTLLFALVMLFNIKAVKIDLKTISGLIFPFVAFTEMMTIFAVASALTIA